MNNYYVSPAWGVRLGFLKGYESKNLTIISEKEPISFVANGIF